MKLLNLFKSKAKVVPVEADKTNDTEAIKVYSGMRVEVTTFDGRLLFVAKLANLHGNKAELHQYLENEIPQDDSPLHVRIRGYNDHEKKAVYMEGIITPEPKHIWMVEELAIVKAENARAFFRLTTNIDATASMFSGLEIGEKPCRLLNISVGGAYIASNCRYYEGDKFLLKVQLLEDRPESTMFCQVLRVIEKNNGKFEYGCEFLELTEDDQKQITRNIFAAQGKKKSH